MGTFKCLNCRIGQTIIKNYKGICKKGITEINRTALKKMSKNLWDRCRIDTGVRANLHNKSSAGIIS